MIIENVFAFLNSNADFFPTLATKQIWKKEKFSYMNTPRPDYGLLLLTEGRIKFESKDITLMAYPGDVIFLPKNSYYQNTFFNKSAVVSDFLVNFDSTADCHTVNSPVKIAQNSSFSVETQFMQLVENALMPNHSTLRNKGLFYLLLDSVTKSHEEKIASEHRKIIHKAQELLQENESISITDIAKICCISESSLRRLFKKNMGISPSEYKTSIKLNKAKYLLESSDMSTGEIAEILQFFDAAYFCKIFAKYEGMTPSAYRRNKKL